MRRKNGGFAILSVIFVTIMLLGVMAAVLSVGGRQSGRVVAIDGATMQVVSQANLIRQAISQCVLEYPEGDNGTTHNIAYPGAVAWSPVSGLTCPGAPAGDNGILDGSNGVFLPKEPNGFGSWQYLNDATGVHIAITSDGTEESLVALNKAYSKFSSSEAYISGGISLGVYLLKP